MSERRQRQEERRRIRRNRRIAAAVLLIGVFILGLICGGRMVNASKPEQNTYKYYKEVRVDRGETLWDIANDYITDEYRSTEAYIEEVCEINAISGTEIYYGQHLMVPYYSKISK